MIDRHLRATVLLTEAAAVGVSLEDLIAAHPGPAVVVPTLAEHVEAIAPTFGAGAAATYRSYWRLAVGLLGDRRLTEITVADLGTVVTTASARARQRRAGSTGRSSTESCVAALRARFGRAHAAGLIPTNPAAALSKPRRARSRRRALDDTEIAELVDAIRTTSDDPDGDLLLVRFHLETGARRQGALSLRLVDIDQRRSTAWLQEKNGNEREQPLSPTLTHLLIGHATGRGATGPDDSVFRRRSGRPITGRRYDTIFSRARACLPPGPNAHPCPRTSCATPPSTTSPASPATQSHRPSPATPHHMSPAATSKPPSPRSPTPSQPSPANPTHWPHHQTRTSAG
jgi:integrase